MSANFYSGSPGSGKSLLAVYNGIEALLEHKNVIANFPFDMNYFKHKKRIGKFIYKKTDEITPKFLIEWAQQNHVRTGKKAKKVQTLVILDEAEMIFNSRAWDKDNNRSDWINFLANHRHLNYDFIIIAPMDKMIDRQIRGIFTLEYKCRSITAFGLPGKIISFLFGGLFCAVPYNYQAHVKFFLPHFFRLHRRKARVYDTMKLFDGMAGATGAAGAKGVEKNVHKKVYGIVQTVPANK